MAPSARRLTVSGPSVVVCTVGSQRRERLLDLRGHAIDMRSAITLVFPGVPAGEEILWETEEHATLFIEPKGHRRGLRV
jgi:hypothetical protein